MVSRVRSIARGQFYYGWVIVAVSFVVQFILVSPRMHILGVFVKPMTEQLGWSRAMYSGVLSFGWVMEGVISPFVGPILDKRGGRTLMIVGAFICGAGYIALGFVQDIWQFYFVRGIIISFGIVCAGSLVLNVTISNWFIRHRGKAVSVSLMGISLGATVLVPAATWLILTSGWRLTWVVLGIAIWILVIPLAALFIRRRPEDIGLAPDGAGVRGRGTGVRDQSPVPQEVTWTRQEAMRTPTLWLTTVAFGLATMAGSGLTLHFIPYLLSTSLTQEVAVLAFSLHSMTTMACKPLWGVFIDKYRPKPCGVAALGSIAVAAIALVVVSESSAAWPIFFAAFLLGFGFGGMVPVVEVLWANYFGRLSLGTVRSVGAPFMVVFSAGGPFFAGWAYDTFNSYRFAFTLFAVAYAVGAFLIYVSPSPRKAPKVDPAPVGSRTS